MKNAELQIEQDTEFQTTSIASFHPGKNGYSLTFDTGWSFWMPDVGIVPEVGHAVKLYGRGVGHSVRGLVVNDHVVFYRTAEEHEAQKRKERAAHAAEKRKNYDAAAADYDARVQALPLPFRTRIKAFRAWQPKTWKYDFEEYELFTCEQAVLIAAALQSPEEVAKLHKLPLQEQQELVPSLSADHFGNTFGVACRLAALYLAEPDLVPLAHGALCPLVGCEEYGCTGVRLQDLLPRSRSDGLQWQLLCPGG